MAALIFDGGNQFCAGTLVASKYVVSAAHCMFERGVALSTSAFKVRRKTGE